MFAGDNPKDYENLSDPEKKVLLNWIRENFIYIRTTNTSYSSYGLKHLYEQATGNYITNGQFKGAMLEAGFNARNKKEQNWYFNISKRSPAFKK
jgi:hypothetical protein